MFYEANESSSACHPGQDHLVETGTPPHELTPLRSLTQRAMSNTTLDNRAGQRERSCTRRQARGEGGAMARTRRGMECLPPVRVPNRSRCGGDDGWLGRGCDLPR
jgi:hypothetical protein